MKEERFQNPLRDHFLLLPGCEGFHRADFGVCPAEQVVISAREHFMQQEMQRKVAGKSVAPQQLGSEPDSRPSRPLYDIVIVKQKQRWT